MDGVDKDTADVREVKKPTAPASASKRQGGVTSDFADAGVKVKRHSPGKQHKHGKRDSKLVKLTPKKSKKQAQTEVSSSEESSTDSDDTSSESDMEDTLMSDSESAIETRKKPKSKKRAVTQKSKKRATPKKHAKSGKSRQTVVETDSGSDAISDDDSKVDSSDDEDSDREHVGLSNQIADLDRTMKQLLQQTGMGDDTYLSSGDSFAPSPARETPASVAAVIRAADRRRNTLGLGRFIPPHLSNQHLGRPIRARNDKQRTPRPENVVEKRKAAKLDFKRVDQVWDKHSHQFVLRDTAVKVKDAHYDDYVFHIRRTFDWEGKFKSTFVDIKSKLLRECLQKVIGNVKGVSLVDETPKLDPNMLFLYSEDLRAHLKQLKKEKPSGDSKKERKKEAKRIKLMRKHLKLLLKYIDKDYADIKDTLYPMLENGLITFDLLWALWKPDTLAYTSTYGSHDEPRVIKIELAEKHYSMMKGYSFYIEGKYLEYDGKQFGYGAVADEMADFKGARKITSLSLYPLKYHKNEVQLRKDLIERGKKFVSLGGVHYKSHQGMAFIKRKKAVIKVNINGRIIVDPSTHRRINPNYPNSVVRPKDHDMISDDEESDCGCGDASEEEEEADQGGAADGSEQESKKIKFVTRAVKNENGKVTFVRLPKMVDDEEETTPPKLGEVTTKREEAATKPTNSDTGTDAEETSEDEKDLPVFSDEDYLIASPVVLSFAFGEKLWIEASVSGVKEIQWNEKAYESLVLEPKTKDIVKALVESHKYHAAESIDDVIQGKGKGLVAVLHGPPGTGKTLTAEGISEFLKCPLYMASAGELGTDSRVLEAELQKILDVCHAWGAILLLDEADVFLEKRNMHDIHRNALVSIFLRQLEYFQGILFLTTNRVETFDEAFQSRIHIALRYDPLDHKAKKTIFQIFIERVRILEKIDLMPFTEEDYNNLARHDLNGRQIKNAVITAQALAVNKGEPLAMSHIRQVLDVQMSFARDLKGGTGYQDAMRSYF